MADTMFPALYIHYLTQQPSTSYTAVSLYIQAHLWPHHLHEDSALNLFPGNEQEVSFPMVQKHQPLVLGAVSSQSTMAKSDTTEEKLPQAGGQSFANSYNQQTSKNCREVLGRAPENIWLQGVNPTGSLSSQVRRNVAQLSYPGLSAPFP